MLTPVIILSNSPASSDKLPGPVLLTYLLTKWSGVPTTEGKLLNVTSTTGGPIPVTLWDADAPAVYKSFEWGAHILQEFAGKNHLRQRFIIGEFGEYWDQHAGAFRFVPGRNWWNDE